MTEQGGGAGSPGHFRAGSLFAPLYDPLLWLPERWLLGALRRRLLSGARGDVIEVGAGTGINFPFYQPSHVTAVWAVEPDPEMMARARRRARGAPVPVHLTEGAGEALPFADGRFDTAVLTLVLCSVSDPARVISELRRVLRPGGRLLMLEHVRSPSGAWRCVQGALAPTWRQVAAGCRLDQDPLPLVGQAFEVERLDKPVAGGPLPVWTLVARPHP